MDSKYIIWAGYFVVYIVFWMIAGNMFMEWFHYDKSPEDKYKILGIISTLLLIIYTIYLYEVFDIM